MAVRVAVCFFGLNRSLSVTLPSIERNIFGALKAAGCEYRVFGGLMMPSTGFSNARSGEVNCMPEMDTLASIPFANLVGIDQGAFDQTINYGLFRPHHDHEYRDDFASIRNILRELFSIRTVYSSVPKGEFDYFLFVRLDLYYHTPLDIVHAVNASQQYQGNVILTPGWQLWGGLNDRFAFAPARVAEVYGHRLDMIPTYLNEVDEPLQAERMLLYTFMRLGVHHEAYLGMIASRVRGNKQIQPEFFDACMDNRDNAARFAAMLGKN
ncbi:hypothetical protein KSF73_12065 [Burkholderiaceae bacterium DAT-1]|nr:hypothetical protein [Burkholderiaceae bacterium DAT-1]